MKLTIYDHDGCWGISKKEEIDSSKGFVECDFPKVNLFFPVADGFTQTEREAAYQAFAKHMAPKFFEQKMVESMGERGETLFNEMFARTGLPADQPIDMDTVQSMYVSALMSGARMCAMAFTQEFLPQTELQVVEAEPATVIKDV